MQQINDGKIGFYLDDRDYAHFLIGSIDIEAQLLAIRSLVARNAAAAQEASKRIDELADWARKTTGAESYRATDEWVDEMHASVYSDAAASMAAVGMFAPLIESLFSQVFRTLEKMYSVRGTNDPVHPRWSYQQDQKIDRWNCNIYVDADRVRTDVAAGIKQLAQASGLKAHIGKSDFKLINALITYRNRMFHMGFEWPLSDRLNFERLIIQNGWSQYFGSSRHNKAPWIFYLSDETVAGLPDFADGLVAKIGRFARSLPRDLLSAKIGEEA
ncbi:hypothetical protein [Rhizobium phaseoli]|uniref:hypothetical protein n=1 Tax=Rhizobium phaseoli TaxID=396 RepID=UPI0007EAB4E8|nr:hypothetical protein [Rhizobium phaseoli]ANL33937.1 hypothetical protein AMC89_CH01864 [Rhizobium phaseoli]ANL97662.1 hypothetical protein AMC79_CH01859 [Rhizobium phaseoli]